MISYRSTSLACALMVYLAGLGSARGAEAVTLHVSPAGNDAWSGRIAKPNAKRTDGPWATPERALKGVREIRKANPKVGPITVILAEGRYELAAPLTFTPEDSGTASSPTRFIAAEGANVVLSGGTRITGWQKKGPDIWMASLPEALRTLTYRHIAVNGQLRQRPRLPKTGTYQIAGYAGADPKARYNTPADRFEFAAGQIDANWKNLTDVEVVVLHFWVDTHLKIRSVDPKKRVVTFDRKSRRRFTETGASSPSARYYVRNVSEAFDSPGEFYHDRSAGTLSYRPTAGEDLTSALVVVPRLPVLVRFAGQPAAGKFIEHIELKGLTFADSTWEPPAHEAVDAQAASAVPGSVVLVGARKCALTSCRVVNVAGYGIDLGEGCRDNRISRCEITQCGAGGIRMTGGAAGSPEKVRTGGNTVEDCHLHHLGELFHSGIGILVMHADHNVIAHNHIHHLYYTGISVGWVWGYKPSVSQGNRIENNYIHHIGQKLLSDMGGIYMLGISPGTVVRGNVIHDVDAYTYGGWGIYTDEGSTGILIEKNLVYRTKTGGFHQHYGKENVVRNNIFALAREDQIQRSRAEPHLSFTFERNIVYYNQGVLLGKKWDDDRFVLDRNLYWRTDGESVLFPGKRTLEQWQARGFDKNSLVADPLFQAPEKGDFRLKEGSPATKIGFEPWDYTTAGIREKKK